MSKTVAVPKQVQRPGGPDTSGGAAAPATSPFQLARMAGSSIASRGAAAWVTDFLNAAYYRRGALGREVDDLRLAFSILTTYWHGRSGHRRLHLIDLPAFHRAFGRDRLDARGDAQGTLDRAQLLTGAQRLIGPWFPDAYADAARRGWGIAFETVEARDAYDPTSRLALARLGALTPELAPVLDRTWHTYPPVEMPSAAATIAALTAPERWPDFASEVGRFTPLRREGSWARRSRSTWLRAPPRGAPSSPGAT